MNVKIKEKELFGMNISNNVIVNVNNKEIEVAIIETYNDNTQTIEIEYEILTENKDEILTEEEQDNLWDYIMNGEYKKTQEDKKKVNVTIDKIVLLINLLKEAREHYKEINKPNMVKKYNNQILLLKIMLDEENKGLDKYIDNLKKRITKDNI